MRTILLLAALTSTAYADPPPRIELATDPLGLMKNSYTLDGVYAIRDHVALTGEVRYDSGGRPADLAA